MLYLTKPLANNSEQFLSVPKIWGFPRFCLPWHSSPITYYTNLFAGLLLILPQQQPSSPVLDGFQVQTWGQSLQALEQGPSIPNLSLLLPAPLDLSISLTLLTTFSLTPITCLCCFLCLSTLPSDPVTPLSPPTLGWVLLSSAVSADMASSRKMSVLFWEEHCFQRALITRESYQASYCLLFPFLYPCSLIERKDYTPGPGTY